MPFTRTEADARRTSGETEVGDLIDRLLDEDSRTDGEPYCIVLLTNADDPSTVILPHAVQNDTVTSSGRNWAWTLGQRYTRLDRLRSGVRFTSEL